MKGAGRGPGVERGLLLPGRGRSGLPRAPPGHCAACGLSLQRGRLLGGVPWIHFKAETRKHSFCPKWQQKLPALAETAIGGSVTPTLGSKAVRCSGQGSRGLLGTLSLHCDISASDLSKRFRAGFAKTWLSSFILSVCNPWMHLSPWLLLLFCPWCGWRCCWGGASKAASHPTWQQAEGALGIFSPHSVDDTGFPLPLHQLLMLPEEQNLLAVLILRFNGVVTFCS